MKQEQTLEKESKVGSRFDLPFTIINLVTTVAAIVLPFFFFSWSAVIAFLVFYTITGLGLTMGYHRLFAHRSYKVPLWLEHIIAIMGYMAIQRGPIFWVSMHRMHHKYADIPGKDPHTPKEGIWHVHFDWLHHRRDDIWTPETYRKLTPDLNKDKLYNWMDSEFHDYLSYFAIAIAAFVLGGFIGGDFAGFDLYNATCFLIWIGVLNRVACLHAFGLINSICHLFGGRPFKVNAHDTSTNNFFVALIIFGEGWHNNHHAFPASAKQGLKWYQIDVAWYVIWMMRAVGLATNVHVARPDMIERRLTKKEKSEKI